MAVDSVNLPELLVMAMKKTTGSSSNCYLTYNEYNTGFCFSIQPNRPVVIPEKIKNCEFIVLITDVKRLQGFSIGIGPQDLKRLVCSPCKYSCRHDSPDYDMYMLDKYKISRARLFSFSKGSVPFDEQIIFVSLNGKPPPKPSAVFKLLQHIDRLTTFHIWEKMKDAWIWKINLNSTGQDPYEDEITRIQREAREEEEVGSAATSVPLDIVPQHTALCVLELDHEQTSPLPHETNLDKPPTTKYVSGCKLNLRRII